MSLRLYARPFLQRNSNLVLARQVPQRKLLRTRNFITIFGIDIGLGSHLTVGIISYFAGVASVFGAAYGLYHYTGLKKAVDTFGPAVGYLTQARDRLATDKIPSHALNYLREAAKAYVAYIPGAGFLVDRTFDRLDETVDAHAEEANAIIGQAYTDIVQIVQQGGNRHETFSVLEILSVCRRLVKELGALGLKAGQPLAEKLELDKKMAAVSASASSLVETVKAKSPEWKQSVDQATAKGVESISSAIRSRLASKNSKEQASASEEVKDDRQR